MNTDYIYRNLTVEDVSDYQTLFFEAVGKDIYFELCRKFGGCTIYFPKEKTLNSVVYKRLKNSGHERRINTMDKEYLLENLTIDDLKEKHKLLFELLGKEEFIEICITFGGTNIAIPQERTLYTNIAKRKIKENKELVQSGVITVQQLAMTYKVNQSFVYKFLKDET